jgi:hypothetical protein
MLNRRNKLEVPPSLAIAKAIAPALDSIPDGEFVASWKWFSNFKKRRG